MNFDKCNNNSKLLQRQDTATTTSDNEATTSVSTNASLQTSPGHRRHPRPTFTYDLPYNVRKGLCDLLDADGSWEQLAGECIGFNDTQIRLFSHALLRRESPTNDLLMKWEQRSPLVGDLFLHLYRLKHVRGMIVLLPFVDEKMKPLCEQVRQETQETASLGSKADPIKSAITTSKGGIDVPFLRVEIASDSPHNSLSNLGAVGGQTPTNNNIHAYVNERKVINQQNQHQNLSVHWNDLSPSGRPTPSTNVVQTQTSSSIGRASSILTQTPDDDMEVNYKELVIATDDFCKERIIGSGGFGVVYRGEWKGTQVAIKKLKGIDNVAQAINEFKVLNRYRIDNIVPLYGISLDGPEACLVYQYMPNGSLEDKLLGKCKKGQNAIILSWNQRAHIGEGIAKGLNYLHTLKGKPLVHGDVKAANVLLDAQLDPKLGDFGLSKMISSSLTGDKKGVYTHLTVTSVHGTSVYLPAEYLRQKILSPAVDVYSYGIVMLEMDTGRRAFDGHKLLVDLVQDEILAGQTDSEREGAIKLKDPRLLSPVSLSPPIIVGLSPLTPSNNLLTTMTCSTNPTSSNVSSLAADDAISDNHWFHSLITLGLDCAHKSKKKRPSMSQVLDFYNQCKTRDRIRRISVESGRQSSIQGRLSPKLASTSTATGLMGTPLPPDHEVKTPLELQLWYDMVKRDNRPTERSTVCPTLGSSPRDSELPPSFSNISIGDSMTMSMLSRDTMDDDVDVESPTTPDVPRETAPPEDLSASVQEETLAVIDDHEAALSTTSTDLSSVNSVIPLLTELGVGKSSSTFKS